MTITNGYSALSDLQIRIGDASTSTTNQAMIEDAIENASRIIDDYTNSFFYTKALTDEYIDASGISDNGLYMSPNLDRIYAPAPIISVTSISEDGAILVKNSDYYIYKTGYLLRNGNWSSTIRGIIFNGSIGYSAAPRSIKEACVTLAIGIARLGKRALMDENGGLQGLIQDNSIPKWVWNVLDRYKRIYT